LCTFAQLRFTATNGFRITMVSLSQLQLSRVVGIDDKLLGLISHCSLLQIIPKVSKHFMFNLFWLMKSLSIWNGHNGFHLITSIESSPGRLLTNLLDWSHILFFFWFLTRSICAHICPVALYRADWIQDNNGLSISTSTQ
jgi:hypothetical protein